MEIPASFKEIEVYGLGDFHVGNPYHSPGHLKYYIDLVREKPNAYCILNGDLAECVIPSGKIPIWGQTMPPREQRDVLIRMLRPLTGKILGVTRGNHEDRIFGSTSMDICADVADACKAFYDPEGAWIEAVMHPHGRAVMSFRLYASHGYGGARKIGAKVSKTEQLVTAIDADVYFVAHDHVEHFHSITCLSMDKRKKKEGIFTIGRAISTHQALVGCGAFVKHGGYSRRGWYQPTDLGTPKVTLVTGRNKEGGVDHNRKIIKVEFVLG